MKFSELEIGAKFNVAEYPDEFTKVQHKARTCCTKEHNATYISQGKRSVILFTDDQEVTCK